MFFDMAGPAAISDIYELELNLFEVIDEPEGPIDQPQNDQELS
jgi:hypothetical protein